MCTKTNYPILAGLAVLLIVAFTALSMPEQVSAAPTTMNSTGDSCLACHEDLYYLHDTGCWYCMTDAHKDRCTDCHEGNPAVFKEEDAHLGLLEHPQENDGAKCRQCHAEDTQAYLVAFDSLGGFETIIKTEPYTPGQAIEAGFQETAQPDIAEILPWAAAGVALFGFWLALVLLSPQKP